MKDLFTAFAKQGMSLFFFVLINIVAQAQSIRAIFANPPSTDNGFEYVEIQHTPSTALTGLTLLEIDGDGTSAGIINSAISLNSYSTGSNGLLLIRDAATVLNPAPSAETAVEVFNFNPDIQNGTSTFLIVSGFTGAVGNDIDSNDDGVVNTTVPWSTVVDGISVSDGTAGDDQYADDYGFTNLPDIATYAYEALVKQDGTWYAVDIATSAANPGPYAVAQAWDAAGTSNLAFLTSILTPGVTANPLPVDLIGFTVKAKANVAVTLQFATASERNSSHFDIERSGDGTFFEKIGEVKSVGNSASVQHYTFDDESPLKGVNYYRLRQVDNEGQTTVSIVRNVRIGAEATVTVYPTLVSETLTIQLDEPFKSDATWQIIDQMGRLVAEGTLAPEQAKHTVAAHNLVSGNYTIRIVANQISVARQFQKK